MCKPVSTYAGVTNRDIVAHMNPVFTNSTRLVTGGVEFTDTRSVLRSVTLATQAHTFSFIGSRGQKRQKGTTIAAVTGVVPTMTSDFNVILDVSSRISSKSILKISFMGTLISRLVISRGMRFQLRRLSIKPSTLRKRHSLLVYCGAHHLQLCMSYSAPIIEPYLPQILLNTFSAPTSTRRAKIILPT